MKNSIFILLMFITGVVLALYKFLPDFLMENDFSKYSLYALMFFVGVGIGADSNALSVIRKTKIKIILVPLCVIVGSLFGAAIISFFISEISITEAMAIGAGFGYYSLSSIFITEISGETLGVIALLSNISREIITLLATPFFVKHFGKLGGIASGGATSMDTCLPIISESTGKEWAIIAVFSGVVLTIVVPFLVPFILSFV